MQTGRHPNSSPDNNKPDTGRTTGKELQLTNSARFNEETADRHANLARMARNAGMEDEAKMHSDLARHHAFQAQVDGQRVAAMQARSSVPRGQKTMLKDLASRAKHHEGMAKNLAQRAVSAEKRGDTAQAATFSSRAAAHSERTKQLETHAKKVKAGKTTSSAVPLGHLEGKL